MTTTPSTSKYIDGQVYEMRLFDGKNQSTIPVIKVDEDTAQYYAFRELNMSKMPSPTTDCKPDCNTTYYTIDMPIQPKRAKIRVHKRTETVVGYRCSSASYCMIDPASLIADIAHARIKHYYSSD